MKKSSSVFNTPALSSIVNENVKGCKWAAEIRDRAVEDAKPWLNLSDAAVWRLMFGPSIKRSWMVWSNGFCPSCKVSVPMYKWKVDAWNNPWKLECPHCKEIFPKNDFAAFYKSGLNEHGVFDPQKADRKLLFNCEHPDPSDPLHSFGVDDGDGWSDGVNRWMFVGAYLIYGQWKQLIVGGASNLSMAYVMTGDERYAHKAGILLDRIADLYPEFDFITQGTVYEVSSIRNPGYVSVWHDACEETRKLVMAYDFIFDAIKNDSELVTFLSRKAADFILENKKSSFPDIQRNIEDGILRDALANPLKIKNNYPRAEYAKAIIMTVLGWPENRDEIYRFMDGVLAKATAVDGVTGEKGLSGYAMYVVNGIVEMIGYFSRIDPQFVKNMAESNPGLKNILRFFIDTRCIEKYYPLSGDTGEFAAQADRFAIDMLQGRPGFDPSTYSFISQLYEITGDPALVQTAYSENGKTVDNLPYDVFFKDPAALQRRFLEVIDRYGDDIKLDSVNKEQWHIAILRSGGGGDGRALWLDYDSGGAHGHADCMNLGLFAKGLDLMPDFGYPPVRYGGWETERAMWYKSTAAHNTVVVDGENSKEGAGETALWAVGKAFRAIRASGEKTNCENRYERTAALIDISPADSYVLDVFRVTGGSDHVKYMHSGYGSISTEGLSLSEMEPIGSENLIRGFSGDKNPENGWSADWKIEDRYGYLPENSDVHLRYTDLTDCAEAVVAECWISGVYSLVESWIPTVLTRRRSPIAPLESTFAAIIEPYERESKIKSIRRVPLCDESDAAVEVVLKDGRRDLLIAADPGFSNANSRVLTQNDNGIQTDAELALVRYGPQGGVQRIVFCKGSFVRVGSLSVESRTDFAEVEFNGESHSVASGEESVTIKMNCGKP